MVKISTDSVAGSLPDVLNVTQAMVAQLARKKLVLDMASVATDAEGTYVPTAWQSFKVGTPALSRVDSGWQTPPKPSQTTSLPSSR